MTEPAAVMEPVVSVHGSHPSESCRAALSDVLIVASADQIGPADRCAWLFAHYPGLTLVLIPQPSDDAVVVGVRNGAVLRMRRTGAVRPCASLLTTLAVRLYALWSSGAGTASWRSADIDGWRILDR